MFVPWFHSVSLLKEKLKVNGRAFKKKLYVGELEIRCDIDDYSLAIIAVVSHLYILKHVH